MHNPGMEHWKAAKWILKYLHGTRDIGLCFQKQNSGNFAIGYVDSDFGGDFDNGKSRTGYLFTMAQAPICWRSILQSTPALSVTEAEYMAAAEAVKEALWLHGLVNELGVSQNQVEVNCDSQSAIHLAKNQIYHARTKHINVRFHKIRDEVEKGRIVLVKISTENNPADMLTKAVVVTKFIHCLNLVNVVSV
jgi:hypothetical protein